MINHIKKLNRPLASFVQVSSDALQNLIAQLIELSSRGDIRVTDDGRYSVYDVIGKIAEKGGERKVWERLAVNNPEVRTKCHYLQFQGAGQRSTPVTDLAGIIEIIWLLPGDFSNKFRKLGAQLAIETVEALEPTQTKTLIHVEKIGSELRVSSELVAPALGIQHRNLLSTVREHLTEIEQAFGRVAFETRTLKTAGGLQKIVYALFTEDQAIFVTTLSRNTPQVIQAKIQIVKAFSDAKKQIQGDATLNQVTIEAMMRRLERLDVVLEVNQEYLNLRRYSDQNLPGLTELADKIIDSRFALPAATVHFTAPEWVERHAPELSQRQRICFYKEIAAAHRFLVGCMPQKIKGKYWYTNKHEILFERAYLVATTMIPVESKQLKPEICFIFPLAEQNLCDFERSLLGEEMKVTQLAKKLNLNLSAQNQSKLGVEVKKMVKAGIIARPKIAGSSSRIFQVTPVLITVVKEFAHGTC